MTLKHLATLLILAAAVPALSACGRKAPLDTPYQAALDAREEAAKLDQPLPPEPEKPVEDKPFILDGLLR
jgi:predicted small lipoprotein YifL